MRFLLACMLALSLSAYAIENAGDPCYEVGGFRLVYDTPHPKQVPLSRLENLLIELSIGLDGFAAPGGRDPTYITLAEFNSEEQAEEESAPEERRIGFGKLNPFKPPSQKVCYPCFHKSALQAICARLLRYLTKEGMSGVAIQVSQDEISAEGADRRRSCRYLTLHIRTAVVGEVGAYRIDESDVDKRMPRDSRLGYIVAHSPLHPSLSGDGHDGDLFSKEKLDSYLSFLNRHPNRKVDARIYALQEDNRLGIDYLVYNNKPWRVFFDVGNTGNHVTGVWQETVGYLNTQLTGVDDVLRLDWTTDSFHSFYTAVASYDRPIMAWPKARWKVYGMFNRYAASDLGFQDKIFVGTQGVVDLSFKETAVQKGSFFFDFTEGLRYYNIHVTNKLALIGKGKSQFASPTFGFQMEQVKSLWRFFFKFEGQTSPNEFLASSRKDIDLLGRLDASQGWTILNANFFTGLYLNFEKPVHEFIFAAQGQYAFNYRLIPQLKFVVGGFNTVRGYQEAINSGDSAVVGRAEYVFHLPPLFNPNPQAKTKLFGKKFRIVPEYAGDRADWDFMLRFFVDAARSIDNNRISGLEENSSLISTGLGTEIDLWQNFMIRLDWGITLQDAVKTDQGHSIVYLNSTVSY